MSLRNDWEFEYGIEEVKDAAERMVQYHDQRKEWWEGERERVVEKLKESGLEVRDYEVTGGKQAQVVVDPELGRRLNECQTKIAHHESDTEGYEAWAQVLHARVMQNDQRTLQLDHQDILYFGLHKTEE